MLTNLDQEMASIRGKFSTMTRPAGCGHHCQAELGNLNHDTVTLESWIMIRRIANEPQMREMREQIRSGADLTSLKWGELVNIDQLKVDDAEPIVAEIEEFLGALRDGRRPAIDAEAGFANVRTAQRIVDAIKRTMQ